MTDIYTNTSAFGLMSEEMQAQMNAHPGLLQYYSTGNGWVTMPGQPGLYDGVVYRAVRPPEPPKVYEAWMVVVGDRGYGTLSCFKATAEGMAREYGGTVIHLTGSKKDD